MSPWRVILLATAVLAGTIHGGQKASAEPSYDGSVREHGYITDRWGTRLAVTYDFPAIGGTKAPGPFPVVLTLCYGDNADVGGEAFPAAGYVRALVGWNGRFGSEGWNNVMGRQSQLSGYDAVEWLAGFKPDGSPSPAASWSNGKVAMYGWSGCAWPQATVAQHAPPHLVTIAPVVGISSPYLDVFYRGGLRSSVDYAVIVGAFTATNYPHCQRVIGFGAVYPDSLDPTYTQECMSKRAQNIQLVETDALDWWQHPTFDAYWDELTPDPAKVTVPVLLQGAWDDIFARGTVKSFEEFASGNKVLIMGYGRGHSPGPTFDPQAEAVRWFDYWMKGIDDGVSDDLSARRFRYRVMPDGGVKEAANWPIPGTEFTNLYLSPGPSVSLATGSLSEVASRESAGSDAYRYNPTQGRQNGMIGLGRSYFATCTVLRSDCERVPPLVNANDPTIGGDERASAPDSLTYVSAPMASDTEMTGPISATLYAASTAQDTDWVVSVIDVYPDGTPVDASSPQPEYWAHITTGWLKGTHRFGHEREVPIALGQIAEYVVDVMATSHVFKAGHRIGVQIASADIPKAFPNPNPATNTIWRTAAYPSHVTLPLVP
jgi:hypothetical protein